jgi:TetR/AcrR family transcriptional repressor of nem operon
MSAETPDLALALRRYPEVFRVSPQNGNRMCLCSFMAAEHDDLQGTVKHEVQAFADVNIAWLGRPACCRRDPHQAAAALAAQQVAQHAHRVPQ